LTGPDAGLFRYYMQNRILRLKLECQAGIFQLANERTIILGRPGPESNLL
jgi:hypothetical protein